VTVFYRSQDPTNSIKVLKETCNTQITEKHNNRTHITKNTANPLVYTNMGWLPQRAGLPGLNGGGTAATVPPYDQRDRVWFNTHTNK